MYRFNDEWRKRLLEDALVAELLAGKQSSTQGDGALARGSTESTAATTKAAPKARA